MKCQRSSSQRSKHQLDYRETVALRLEKQTKRTSNCTCFQSCTGSIEKIQSHGEAAVDSEKNTSTEFKFNNDNGLCCDDATVHKNEERRSSERKRQRLLNACDKSLRATFN